MSRRVLLALAALSLSATLATPAHAAPTARLHLQVPLDRTPEATNLNSVESYGANPYLERSFEVPYAALEKQIEKALKDAIKSPVTGHYDLPDPAPMLDFSISIVPKVRFLKKNQPTFTQVGASSNATFDTKLDTRVRADVHIAVHAEIGSETIDVPIDAHVTIDATGKLRMKLWPTISAESVDIEFSVSDSNLDLELNGTAMALGAKLGVLVGLSPAGVFGGGLLLGPIAAIVADAAADMAEDKLSEAFNKELKKLVPKYGSTVEKIVKDALDPQLAAADAVKDKALAKQVPGTGKTVQQLLGDLGASFEVHVATPGDALAVAATLRMTGAAAGGKLRGKIRVPKQECTYVSSNNGWLKGAKIPMTMVPTNEDLAGKVGKSCSSVLSASALSHEVYLGANPRTVLGSEGEQRTTWKSSGDVELTGNLVSGADYYECGFEIDALPKVTIFDLESAGPLQTRLNEETFDERMMVLPANIVLDHNLDPWAAGGVVVGGPGQCHGHAGGGKALTRSQIAALRDAIDPEHCPNCGLERVRGSQDWRVNDMAAFDKSVAGAKIKGVVGNAASAPRAPAAKTPRAGH